MKSTISYAPGDNYSEVQAAGKEYRWKSDGKDGFRSYSFTKSNSTWSYSTEPDESNKSYGAYAFSDSSTGQPSARRGNLYNWTAATLGSGLNIDGGQATDSICPHGWRLPIGGTSSLIDRTFYKQIKAYAIANDVAGWNRLVSWPLQYLPTGYYSTYNGYAVDRTSGGEWWSGIGEEDGYSYHLHSEIGGNVYDDEPDANGNGFARRCRARHQRNKPRSLDNIPR